MRLLPLVHCRNFHAATVLPDIMQEPINEGVMLKSSSSFSLLSDRAKYVQDMTVYYNFEYEAERRRGMAWRENLFCSGHFDVEMEGENSFCIMASAKRNTMLDADEALGGETIRLQNLKAPLPRLAQAADSFVVKRGTGKSIIAGYHWFDDWGRDAPHRPGGCMSQAWSVAEVLRVWEDACGK
jgi:predicted glycogen debranching enzyme